MTHRAAPEGRIRSCTLRVLRALDGCLLAGIVTNAWASRRIRRSMEEANQAESELISERVPSARQLPEAVLNRFEERELERRRSLEDKAKANVLGITLAFSVLTASLSFWLDGPDRLPGGDRVRVGLLISVLVGWLFLLTGGLHALRALAVGRVYVLTPEDYMAESAERINATRLFYLHQNQGTSLLRANSLSVSFAAIRNGVLALAVGVAIVAGAALVGPRPSEPLPAKGSVQDLSTACPERAARPTTAEK